MSEITLWKVRRLCNLHVPLRAIADVPNLFMPEDDLDDWEEDYACNVERINYGVVVPMAALIDGSRFRFYRNLWAEDAFVMGAIRAGDLRIRAIKLMGRNSDEPWKPLLNVLRQSRGVLRVRVAWDGGERIGNLNAVDGVVEYTEDH